MRHNRARESSSTHTNIESPAYSPDAVAATTPAATANDDNAQLEMAYSAMSLDMDNADLMYNLYFFGGQGAMANMQAMYSTAMEETYAAHSAENTYVPLPLHQRLSHPASTLCSPQSG